MVSQYKRVTPRIQLSIFYSDSCLFRRCDMSFPSWLGFVFVLLLLMSCISYHVIMCISFAYVFVSCIRAFFPFVRFAIRHSHVHRRTPLVYFCVRVLKRSRNGSRLDKWPWYTTGRPPVKFRVIWRLFDTPTVNRVTAKASFGLQPNTPSKQPNNPSKSLPCSRSFDHDRVGENRASFGLS